MNSAIAVITSVHHMRNPPSSVSTAASTGTVAAVPGADVIPYCKVAGRL